MLLSENQRQYIGTARVGRLATADDEGRPHVIPICYSLIGDELYTPLDEKPQDVEATDLRRVQNIRQNPHVSVVIDHYTEQWDDLGWVQLRGTAAIVEADDPTHARAVTALRDKYHQYTSHELEQRPLICVVLNSTRSWGQLDCPPG
jgi:PPOX class probable F420-dependent enzyme